jgi:hypothetical protein
MKFDVSEDNHLQRHFLSPKHFGQPNGGGGELIGKLFAKYSAPTVQVVWIDILH